jgi:ferrochelatase
MTLSSNLPPHDACLVVNLGTPDSPSTQDVRKYLDQFLMDPFVIDLSPWKRWILVKGIILNTRPKKSAEAYQKIWTERGSPLKFHLDDLVNKLRLLNSDRKILIYGAMRYGNPSVSDTLDTIAREQPRLRKLRIFLLYPQWAWASSGSSEHHIFEEIQKRLGNQFSSTLEVEWVPPFYDDQGFIKSWASKLKNYQASNTHFLMSFHGIPERQLCYPSHAAKLHCLSSNACCETASKEVLRTCYRAQCFKTAQEIAQAAGIQPQDYTVSFQSRLGRTPWLKPFTDLWLESFAKSKLAKNVVVVCPSFVSDCLETTEEIGIRAKQEFEAAVDQKFKLHLVPSLNSDDLWVQAAAALLQKPGYSVKRPVRNLEH